LAWRSTSLSVRLGRELEGFSLHFWWDVAGATPVARPMEVVVVVHVVVVHIDDFLSTGHLTFTLVCVTVLITSRGRSPWRPYWARDFILRRKVADLFIATTAAAMCVVIVRVCIRTLTHAGLWAALFVLPCGGFITTGRQAAR